MEGRKAVNLLADAYGLAIYESGKADRITITKAIMERTAQASRLSPCLQQEASDTPKIGHIYGLGVIGSWGSTIEIEAAAFPPPLRPARGACASMTPPAPWRRTPSAPRPPSSAS